MHLTLACITKVLETASRCNNVVPITTRVEQAQRTTVPASRLGGTVVVVGPARGPPFRRDRLPLFLRQALRAESSKEDFVGGTAVFRVILEPGTLEVLHRVDLAGDIRDSPLGGTSHACELETSMYLTIRPKLVDMSLAVDENQDLYAVSNIPTNRDLVDGMTPGASQVSFWPYWSSISRTGVRGYAAKATAERGERFLAAAATGLAELIRESCALTVQDRVDHH
jgi:hypothetical protein